MFHTAEASRIADSVIDPHVTLQLRTMDLIYRALQVLHSQAPRTQ